MSEPFPKGLVMEAWNASVGYSCDSTCKYLLVTHAGTRSHLFSNKSMCLCFAFRCRCRSKCRHRVPKGSRASNTWMSTSDESTTLYLRKRKERKKEKKGREGTRRKGRGRKERNGKKGKKEKDRKSAWCVSAMHAKKRKERDG